MRVQQYFLSWVIDVNNKCPKCGSKNIWDHSEFGLPCGNNMRCECGHLWVKKDEATKKQT